MSVYIGLTGLEARGLSPCACLETELNTSLVVKVKGPDTLATPKTGLHQGSMHKNTTSALLLFLIHLLRPVLPLSEFLASRLFNFGHFWKFKVCNFAHSVKFHHAQTSQSRTGVLRAPFYCCSTLRPARDHTAIDR